MQLVVTSAFAHAMTTPQHCSLPSAQHSHDAECSAPAEQAIQIDAGTEQQPMPTGLLHCASVVCTAPFDNAAMVEPRDDVRNADLNPAEPRRALQSVLLSHLRPPLV
nr:hypothetical protein [Paracoccus sp. C2R09]